MKESWKVLNKLALHKLANQYQDFVVCELYRNDSESEHNQSVIESKKFRVIDDLKTVYYQIENTHYQSIQRQIASRNETAEFMQCSNICTRKGSTLVHDGPCFSSFMNHNL